jgi:hypothetical protein
MRMLRLFLFALTTTALTACGGGDSSSPLITPIPLSNFTGTWLNCTAIDASPLNLGIGQRGLQIQLNLSQDNQLLKEQRSAKIFTASDCSGEQVLTTESNLPLPNKYLGQTSTSFYQIVGATTVAKTIFNQAFLLDWLGEPQPTQALLGINQGKLQIALMPKGSIWDSQVVPEIYTRTP